MKVVVLTKSEWPTEWDWVLSRPIITQLYIRERRTLKSVMAIMRTEYAFKATYAFHATKGHQLTPRKNKNVQEPPRAVGSMQIQENKQIQVIGSSSE